MTINMPDNPDLTVLQPLAKTLFAGTRLYLSNQKPNVPISKDETLDQVMQLLKKAYTEAKD
jgi:hypothetical protein